MAKGCEWNNQLEKENFRKNLEVHGLNYAKQILRTNIQHWMAKREGREIPKWKATVDDGGHLVVDNRRLVDITQGPLTRVVTSPIPPEVKKLVPIEVATVLAADALANQGAKQIIMPEHAPTGIRFVTVYTQDPNNPRDYTGSQIDLEKSMSAAKARNEIQKRLASDGEVKYIQSSTFGESFVFSVTEQSSVKSNGSHMPGNQVNDMWSGGFVRDIADTSSRVYADVSATAATEAAFMLEAMRRRRAARDLEKQHIIGSVGKTVSENNFSAAFWGDMRLQKIESPVVSIEELKKLWMGATATRETVASLAQMGVGIGIALYGIRLLAELPKIKLASQKTEGVTQHVRKNKKEQKSVSKERRRRKKEAKRRPEKKARRKKKTERLGIPAKKETKKKRRKWAKEKRLMIGLERTRRRKKKRRTKEIRKTTASKEKKKRVRREPLLFMLKNLAKRIRTAEKRKERKKIQIVEPARQVVKKKKELAASRRQEVRRFSFAFVLWMLLVQAPRTGEYKENSIQKPRQKKETPRIVISEHTIWVLLAIIWHLAVFREHGTIRSGTKRQKPRKKKQQRTSQPAVSIDPSFSPRGVIFTFAT